MSSSPASLFESASTGNAAPPAALVEAVRALEVLAPSERRFVLRSEAALLLDGLLVRVARSRSALDVALCEGLGALSAGDRLLRLGWSGVGDYARERLGVAGRTGQVMARLGRALAERPLLQAAIRSGEVSVRAAEEIIDVAAGVEESAWVERARRLTVRGLAAEVRAARAAAAHGDPRAELGVAGDAPGPRDAGAAGDAVRRAGRGAVGRAPPTADTGKEHASDPAEPWQAVSMEVSAGTREALRRALDLAGQVLGEGAPRWQRVEALAQEYLGTHGGDEPDDEVVAGTLASWRGDALEDHRARQRSRLDGAPIPSPHDEVAEAAAPGEPGWRAQLEAFLEEEHGRWSFLEAVGGQASPVLEVDAHPARLDAALRRLAGLRQRWDSLLGHLSLLVRLAGLWRDLQFASFSHYCRERLGLGVRQVEQRIALERRLHALPSLRAALEQGRLDTERARLVARVADERDAPGWIARAEESTAIFLRREVEALEERPQPTWALRAQVCAPEEPGVVLRLRLPVRVAALLAAALRTAQRRPWPDGGSRWRSDDECLLEVATHFVAAWRDLPRARATPQRRALRRDGHRCQVPGCSRAAVHAHHVRYRSQGGGDDPGNLVSLCAAHHLHGVHRGFIRVRGVAPGGLQWTLGELAAGPPVEPVERERHAGASGASGEDQLQRQQAA